MSQRNHNARGIVQSDKHHTRKLLAAALALALGTVGGGAQASTRLVTNCLDSGSGSMRAAITSAVSGDVVDATALTCSTISLGTGALEVTVDSLTVKGPAPNRLTVQGYTKYSQVLRHEGTGTLALQGLTIIDGVASPHGATPATKGGCIYSKGTVTLGDISNPTNAASGVVVSDCSAISTHADVKAEGGGIFAQNGVTLVSSVVTRSTASAQDDATRAIGGGISVQGGSFTMNYSEVSDCAATGSKGRGGGLYVIGNTATISHSTIADNTATGYGGGAYLGTNTVEMSNSTISGNVALDIAGLEMNVNGGTIDSSTITRNQSTFVAFYNFSGARTFGITTVQSTIISGNFGAGQHVYDWFPSSNTTGANNMVGTVEGFAPPTGLVVTTDPKLGPLTNRGGFTRIHFPLANSLAINAGNNSIGSMNDQRGPGFPRVIGSAPDIGAAEFDPDQIFNNGFD